MRALFCPSDLPPVEYPSAAQEAGDAKLVTTPRPAASASVHPRFKHSHPSPPGMISHGSNPAHGGRNDRKSTYSYELSMGCTTRAMLAALANDANGVQGFCHNLRQTTARRHRTAETDLSSGAARLQDKCEGAYYRSVRGGAFCVASYFHTLQHAMSRTP